MLEVQFENTAIPCLHLVTREVQNLEQTQEVRLPDGMPDIGKILSCRGQVLIRGKQWNSGGISVNGGVMAWVLYMPEGEGGLQWVESWIPFQMKWDFPETQTDGTICIVPHLSSADARSISARKLMVRVGLSVMAEATVDSEVQLFTPGKELPEDVQLLKNTYPVLLPREAGEKAFLVDETLSLPGSMVKPHKLVSYQVDPGIMEQKVLGDKVVFRGVTGLHLLYTDVDGKLHSWDFEMPFSQYAELGQDYAPEAVCRVIPAVTGLELELGEDGGLAWKAALTGQYMVYDQKLVELVSDAYSPSRKVTVQKKELILPSVLDMQVKKLQPEQNIPWNGSFVDGVLYQAHPRVYREGDQVIAEFSGQLQVMGSDVMGEPMGSASRWEYSQTMSAGEDSMVYMGVMPGGKLQLTAGVDTVMARGELPVETVVMARQGIPMVAGMELGEQQEPAHDRPTLILRRAGTDTLWEIAKETGSTVEAIQKANNIQQEPAWDQMLLIPVV